MKELVTKWNSISLVKRIIAGLIIGIILGMVVPQFSVIGLLGQLFVGALKAVAPILVFFLVSGALCQHKEGKKDKYENRCCIISAWYFFWQVRLQ